MIYFIRAANYVKIGYTEKSRPEHRLHQLQSGNPHNLTMLKTIEGTKEREGNIHFFLAPFRKRGEWYYYCDPIRFFTEICTEQFPQDFLTKSDRKYHLLLRYATHELHNEDFQHQWDALDEEHKRFLRRTE